MPLKNFRPSPYIPSSPRSGDNSPFIFRAKNLWIRGKDKFYAECYAGSESLGESIPPVAITGTIAFTTTSKTITGTSTLFTSELSPGQFLLAGTEIIVVDQVLSNTSLTVHRAPTANGSSITAYRMPVLFELDKSRGTLLRGNAIRFEQGHILGVGSGTLRENGNIISGFSASKSPKLALFDANTQTYTSVFTLGLSAPSGVTGAAVSGGTRGMTAGERGIRICRGRKATAKGYGNPGENITVTTTAGQQIELDFTSEVAVSDNGFDGWWIFITEYVSGSSLTQDEGPWYKWKFITADDLTSNKYTFEILNSEITRSELLTFNNDAPCDADFVAMLTGYPILVSCQGKGTATKPDGTSPGPFIVPFKPNNMEAAPLSYPNPVSTSPPETILGFKTAAGRLFLMTANKLQFGAFTGNAAFPITIRPFWQTGFANPYNLAFVNGVLYGATTAGFTRSIAEGDEGAEEHQFAADVEEDSNTWNKGHVLVEYDPKNEAMCFFYSGAYKNDSGYWVTVVLPYLLNKGFWNPPIILESTTQDMIVSGVANVNGFLEFLAGGRKSGGSVGVDTYRFDTGSGQSINWYLAWGYSDDGAEQNAKNIKGFRVTGRFSNATLGIHGSTSDTDIDVTTLEANNSGSLSGAIALDNASNMRLNEWNKIRVPNCLIYTPRIEGTWSGSGEKSRVDEIVLSVNVGGLRK